MWQFNNSIFAAKNIDAKNVERDLQLIPSPSNPGAQVQVPFIQTAFSLHDTKSQRSIPKKKNGLIFKVL